MTATHPQAAGTTPNVRHRDDQPRVPDSVLDELVTDRSFFDYPLPDEPMHWDIPGSVLPTHLSVPLCFDILEHGAIEPPLAMMARDGAFIEPDRYSDLLAYPGNTPKRVTNAAKARAEFTNKTSLILNYLQNYVPWFGDTLATLRREVGFPVKANAYLTPPEARGFGHHWDDHPVLLLQVAGEKHWRLYPPEIADPDETTTWTDLDEQRRREVVTGVPFMTVRLEEGQALWIPRGWIHAGASGRHTSLHITYACFPPRRRRVAETLLDQVLAHTTFRASADHTAIVSGGRDAHEEAAEVVRCLHDGLQSLLDNDADDLAELLAHGHAQSYQKILTRPGPPRSEQDVETVRVDTRQVVLSTRHGDDVSVLFTADGWLVTPRKVADLIAGTAGVLEVPRKEWASLFDCPADAEQTLDALVSRGAADVIEGRRRHR